jgi:cytochrome c oxidase cbb3-type subunit III
MTPSASLFVIIFTVINVLACLWLLWWTARARAHAKPDAGGSNQPERTGHVWDGDLEEYNNPLPRWWLWLFVLTAVFGAAYLTVYPGLGNFRGVSGWSSAGAHDEQARAHRARLDQQLAQFSGVPLDQLAANAATMSTARNLFGANCSTCHGSDARGAKGFPNLTDHDWLWGGSDEAIQESIANGRRAVMPALGQVLGSAGVDEVASYVMSLSGGKAPADWIDSGKERFATLCVGCHGADAKGNQLLGAPDLTDRISLFGGDFDTLRVTIAEGRESTMPAHIPLLGEPRVRLLAAYVRSLSANDARTQAVASGADSSAGNGHAALP